MYPSVLKLDVGGLPVAWVRWQTAATLYARDRVCWEAGAERFVIHGGVSAVTGRRSELRIGSIIAVSDHAHRRKAATFRNAPPLSNRTLFQRDRNLCLYCGQQFPQRDLTRDHILPVSRGGESIWENCVTACRSCNQRKGSRRPEEIGMKLLAVPYTPNLAEYLILSNRRILADQMEFLLNFARKKAKLATA